MRLTLLICAACLVLLVSGCRRGNQSNTNNHGGPAGSPNLSSGDRLHANEFLEKGKELYRNDQDSEAAEALKEAVRLNPDLAEAHFRLGLCYEALNKQEEAESEYKKAIEGYRKYLAENPKDAEAHYNLGQTYAGMSQYSDAVREYKLATKLKEDDADIYFDLGTALMRLAQYDEAAAAFSKSLEIDPENYRAQDALDEAREGVKRIRAGKKHQEDLLKKQKEEELKKAEESLPTSSPSKPTPGKEHQKS